jgi:hypothetical protein
MSTGAIPIEGLTGVRTLALALVDPSASGAEIHYRNFRTFGTLYDTDEDGVGEEDGDGQFDPCSSGQTTACDDNCPGDANPTQIDADQDGFGNACDNCPQVLSDDQADSDADGTGDACSLTVVDPNIGEILNCQTGAIPPTLRWLPDVYDRFKVFVGNDPAFTMKVSSGDTLLRGTAWRIPAKKWKTICRWPGSSVYIRVKGVDLQIPAGRPGRTTTSTAIAATKQR